MFSVMNSKYFYLIFIVYFTCVVIAHKEGLNSSEPLDNNFVISKSLKCENVLDFMNQVPNVLRKWSGVFGECPNCSIYFQNLPCSLSGFAESMLNMHLNYTTTFNNEVCAGLYRRKGERGSFGHMVQFLLDVIGLRHWVSMVLFVDQEDEFPSASFLQILAERNVQGLILKMNPSNMKDHTSVVPSAVSQYYRLVVISRRYQAILEAAQNRSLFLHPYKWIILAESTADVVDSLNRISLQFAQDITIVSPIKRNDSVTNNAGMMKGNGRRLILICDDESLDNKTKKWSRNHLAGLSSKEYRVDLFAMLCPERGLDLLSSGFWKRDMPLVTQRMNMSWPSHRDINCNNFKGCVFRVVVAHNPPYIILNKSNDGNFTLSGYDYDVFMELANLMKFGYEFYIVEDGQYGRLTKTLKRWTGLVGELVAGKAHLALPSLVLTEERYQVVDFSARISTARTKVVIRHLPASIGVDSYLAPFRGSVWCLFACNILIFSMTYVFINAHSPCLYSTRPVITAAKLREIVASVALDKDDKPPRVGFWDSLFSFLSFGLQQASEDSPACWSGRVIIVTFFLFVVILHTSYSSTLVSYMYMLRPQMPFETVSDLATIKDYIPCILEGSSHEELLKAHHSDVLSRIWEHNGQGLVSSNEEGIERVYSGNCAFIADSINIEYLLQHNCSFTYVGKDFIRVHYHLAFQKGFPHQTAFSIFLVKLRQGGHLTRLLRKHMNPMRSSSCLSHSGQTTLGFSHVISMFVQLFVGIVLAIIVVVIERFFYICRNNRIVNVYSSDTEIE